MKFLKPQFWDSKISIITLLLLPLSLIFYLLIILRKSLLSEKNFNIPIICVGNIYVGGTGKTPLSLLIAKELKSKNKRVAIIKKFYQTHYDENKMINNYNNNLILDKNRTIAVKTAERKNFDATILDDGFQDFSIKKDLNIVCFNNKQLIGNGLIFPAGPLRENLSALKRAQIVIVNGKKNKIFEKKIFKISKNIKIFYSKYSPKNINQFRNKKLFAFAGIGNPENFFELLSAHKMNIQKKIAFPDHYNFNAQNLQQLIDYANKNNYKLVTTEKDFFRIKNFKLKKIKYLKVDLVIKEKEKLIREILKIL